jgi:DNA-binding GntR family transcriptional regulator
MSATASPLSGHKDRNCIQIAIETQTRYPVDRVTAGGPRDGQNVTVVHDRLRDAILRGEIPAGEATSQVALAKQLGVSRTPLREALRLLEREGLVLSQPNRRVRIAEFSIADVEGVYAMRLALEAVAIRVTVPTLAAEDFAELEGLMAQMDHYMRAGDQVRMDVPHAAFHARFVAAAAPRLRSTVAQLFDHAARYRLAYGAVTTPDGYDDRRAEHRAMIDAAAAGDTDLTVERLVVHYAHTAMLVISELDPRYEPTVVRAAIEAVAPRVLDELPAFSGHAARRAAAPAPRR